MTTAIEHEQTLATVGKVIEITAESAESFEDAVRRGLRKAAETVDDIKAAWVAGQQVRVKDGEVVAFRVDLKVTFVVH